MSGRRQVRAIPPSAAARIARAYGYDQVIVIGRRLDRIGVDGEHLAVFGRDARGTAEAERLGELARRQVMRAS